MPRQGPRKWRADELAAALGAELSGSGEAVLVDVRSLEEADPEHLSFLSNRKYARKLASSRAGAVLLDPTTSAPEGMTVLRLADPYEAFAKALRLFHPLEWPEAGRHPLAHVAEGALVDGATIEAFAVVEAGAVVEPGAWIQSHAYVGRHARIGAGARLMPHAVVMEGCEVGARSWLNPGSVLGSEGFGFAPTAAGNVKIPQVGRAVLEEDVELGANTTVDRAALGETRIRRGAKLDNLVQVGHAADIGEHSLLVAFAGVAGSSRLGKRTVLGARAGVLGHLELGDGVQVGVAGVVVDSQPAGAKLSGVPAIPHRTWLRAVTAFRELPEQARTIRNHAHRLAELEGTSQSAPSPSPRPIRGAAVASPSDPPNAPSASPPPSAGGPGEGAATDAAESADMLQLNIAEIMKILPHRLPFLLVDRVLEVERGVRAVGIKCVSVNEPWAAGHFPEMPVFPGVLVAEAFAQLCGILALTTRPEYQGYDVYLLGVDKLRLRKPITPGDTLRLEATKTEERRSVWRFACVATVDGVKVATAEIMATVMARPA